MIRIVLFLIVIGALSLGITWLADRPGDVVIVWQGLRIQTSVMALGAAVVATVAILLLLWGIVRAIMRSPAMLSRHLRERRGTRAYEAISRGLIAVGSGDSSAAQKHSAVVNRLAPGEPLALLLSAQAAQLGGDRNAADSVFRAMADRPDTKALGLRGLHVEAQRRGDHAAAHAFAEEAARDNPQLGWAGKAVLEFRCRTGDWAGALALLEAQKPALDRDTFRRQRAVLLTAHALAVEDTDRGAAKALALEAQKLAPTLVPAAALAGRLLAEGGQARKASRVIDTAWRANPHPELAQAYAELRSGDSARDRLKRIEALAARAPGHIEGALATVRAALGAQEFAKARSALAPYLAAPTRRIALLMAELEQAERNDVGRAREWLARAVHAAPDPAWTADGHVSAHWQPASPVTGRLDAFEWRVPLTGITGAATVESTQTGLASIETAAKSSTAAQLPTAEVVASHRDEPSGSNPAADVASKPAPIIPLVHAPDDPGPEAVDESEISTSQENGGWKNIFG